MNLRKELTGALGAFLALGLMLGIATPTFAADAKIKVVFLGNTEDEDYDGSLVFKDFVEAQSNGAIEVEIYPGGQLCTKPTECLEALQAGVIEVHMTTIGGFGNLFPEIQVLDLPYLLSDDRVAEEVFSGPFKGQLRDGVLERTGNIRLMVVTNTGGWRNIANTKRQVKTPADVQGLKLRTINSELQIELVKLLGGAPTPISWPELYTSLATGVVDGSKNGITDIVGMKFHEHVKHITLDGHAYMAALWWMNNDSFLALSPEHRRIVNDGFAHLRNVTTAFPKRRQIAAYEDFKKAGGTIYVPSPAEKEQFVKAAAPLKKWYSDKFGNAWLDKYEKAIADAKAKLAEEYATLK